MKKKKFDDLKNSQTPEHSSWLFIKFFKEFLTVKEPRSLFALAGGFQELMINTLIYEHCKKHGEALANLGFEQKLQLLDELGKLNVTIPKLKAFWAVRNEAAHEPFFEFSESRAEEISRLHQVRKGPGDPARAFCTVIILDFFNAHRKILFDHLADGGRDFRFSAKGTNEKAAE